METLFFYQREYLIVSTMPIQLLAIVLFPLLILFSIKKFSLKESIDDKDILSIDDSLVLRGIAIITIMLHHYSQGLIQKDKLLFYKSLGYVSVAVFLLLSGYSSYIQLSRKGEKFWDKYLIKRLLRLLIPFWVINFIHSLFYRPTPIQFFKATLMCKRIIGDVTQWPTVWFVVTIVYFTLLFWISFRFTNNHKCSVVLFAFGTFGSMIVHLLLLKNQSYWYNTSLAFLTGIIYAMYKDSLKKYFIRYRIVLLLLIGSMFGGVVFVTFQGINPGWLQIICSELVVILLLTLEHFTILRSRLLKVIGAASWEIFLIHQLVYSAYYSACKDFYGLSGVLCIVIAAVSGILICSFDKKIVSLIDKAFCSIQFAISPVRK